MQLEDYNPRWISDFRSEARLIESVFDNDEFIDIQHIGSTAIPGMKSKPIIDIAVLVTPDEFIQGYVRPLNKIGYELSTQSSSIERLFFRKGEPVAFHLSLTQEGKTPFWERQIQFRDYLIGHPDYAKEYELLKRELSNKFPDFGQGYTDGKSDFISKVLNKAKQ
jgi:GrpB-like predicted nucleotidyltransferase (UPF0157 family)